MKSRKPRHDDSHLHRHHLLNCDCFLEDTLNSTAKMRTVTYTTSSNNPWMFPVAVGAVLIVFLLVSVLVYYKRFRQDGNRDKLLLEEPYDDSFDQELEPGTVCVVYSTSVCEECIV